MSVVPLCFIDTETTGLRRPWMPLGRRIWDIGIIRRDPDGTETTYSRFLAVNDLTAADPFALNIGRYHERFEVTSSRHESAIVKDVGELTAGCHLIGAVPSFDEESLAELFFRNGSMPRWHYHLVDVETFAAGALGWEPPYKSDDLFAAFEVEVPEGVRHTAIGDARAASALYDAVLAGTHKVDAVR